MNTLNKLAIVIPAYKKKFFSQTLKSFSGQTCKDFTIYIGDDASPENLAEVVERFRSDLSINYHRFDTNLGSDDLVAHWERCINLIQDEEWIWLFSDDDIVSQDCVRGFFDTLRIYGAEDALNRVFRFPLKVTDHNLNTIRSYVTPDEFTVEYFLENYFITHNFTNRAVEFVFSRTLYNSRSKFVNFPLAWGSDLATFLKFGEYGGYITIRKGEVFWRQSDYNISNINDEEYSKIKRSAYNQRYLWVFGFIQGYSGNQIFYPIIYRVLHYITPSQALSKLAELKIKDFKLKTFIILCIVFIKFKKAVRYRKIKLGLLKFFRIDTSLQFQ